MRRLNGDVGAVAVLVAVLASTVLFGFGALAVDVSALYAERRELQSGADAAALAVVNECLQVDCSHVNVTAVAEEFASYNAQDGFATATVCGSGDASWTLACTPPPGMPQGASYVRVTTTTRNADGSNLLNPILARAMHNNESYNGVEVFASSVVIWGGMQRTGKTIPLIISACEWLVYTANDTKYAPLPTIPTDDGGLTYDSDQTKTETTFPVALEAEVVTHKGTDETCKLGGGFNDVIPGGFGWLKTDNNCDAEATTTETDDGGTLITVDSKQGFNPCLKALMADVLGEWVQIPIFANDPELHTYEISGWADFFITGYSLTGNCPDPTKCKTQAHIPAWDAAPDCFSNASFDCVTGYFLNPPETTAVVGGFSFGETVVQLYE